MVTVIAGVVFVLWFYKSVDWVRHLINVGENPWNIAPYKRDPYNPKLTLVEKKKDA